MRTPITAIVSCVACMLVVCSAYVLLLYFGSAARLLNPAAIDVPDAALLGAAVVSFAAWAGASVWEGAVQARRGRTLGRHGMLLAFAALVTGVLLGAAFCIAVTKRADQAVSIALLVVAAAAMAFICGLAARLQPTSVLLLGVATAAHGVIGGIGFGLQFAASYTDPCLPKRSCLEGSPWLGLQVGLPAGVICRLAPGYRCVGHAHAGPRHLLSATLPSYQR